MADQARKALNRVIAKKKARNENFYGKVLYCGIFDTCDIDFLYPLLTAKGKVISLRDGTSHNLIKELSDLIYWDHIYDDLALYEFNTLLSDLKKMLYFAGIKENELEKLSDKWTDKFKQKLSKSRYPIDFIPIDIYGPLEYRLADIINKHILEDVSSYCLLDWVQAILKAFNKQLSISEKTFRTKFSKKD